MQTILGGQNVTWVIPLETEGGVQLAATAVEYRVIDQHDTVLVAKTAASYVAGSPDVSISVSSGINTLASVAGRELRMIELFVTTADGVFKIQFPYLIEAEALLAIGTNSFQGYASALMTGYELPNVPAWMSASKTERINALVAAWRNLSKLHLKGIEDQSMSRISPFSDIAELSATEFALLSEDLRSALARAQVLEADYLLGGDEVEGIRRSGIMSATVGESSQFFRPAKPYEGPVCKRALKELSKYILQPNRKLARG